MFDRSRVVSAATVLSLLSFVSLAACATTTTPNPPIASPAQSWTAPTGPATSTTAATSTVATVTTSTTVDEDQLAIGAVQRYYAAFNKALTTLKTTEMRKLFQPGCVVCERDAAQIERMARDGDRITGGVTTLTDFTVTLRSAQHLSLLASSRTEAMIIKDATGKVTTDRKAASGHKNFTVFRRGSDWILEGIS